jgi:HAD superfamily hydrolase (TIGR01509 family)
MIRALIFDFDGLILDTEAPEFQCWQEIYEAHGCRLELETWAACIGTVDAFDPHRHLESQLGRSLDVDEVRARRGSRFAELIAEQTILPGITRCIEDAERLGLKLGVASSSSRDWVAGHLSRLGLLGRFAAIKCADDVERVKPDPALYVATLAALGVRPAQALALEDSPNGILAAKRAGLWCVAVPNALTRELALDGADLQVASLDETPLAGLLARLAR